MAIDALPIGVASADAQDMLADRGRSAKPTTDGVRTSIAVSDLPLRSGGSGVPAASVGPVADAGICLRSSGDAEAC
jgi:hypothetical protein